MRAPAHCPAMPWIHACSIGSWNDDPAPVSVPPEQLVVFPALDDPLPGEAPLLSSLPHPASATAKAAAPTTAPVRVSLTSLFLLRRWRATSCRSRQTHVRKTNCRD